MIEGPSHQERGNHGAPHGVAGAPIPALEKVTVAPRPTSPSSQQADHAASDHSRLVNPGVTSGKAERSYQLCCRCGELSNIAGHRLDRLTHELTAIEPLDPSRLRSESIDSIKATLQREIASEKRIQELLGKIHATVDAFDKEIVRGALREYQSSTGLLDDHPRASAAICAGLGITTLSAGIYGAIATHSLVHHAVDTAVGGVFGHGWIGWGASWVAVPVSLFFIGIPVLGSSVLGPIAFGALKTVGGKITRLISSSRREAFKEEQGNSQELRTRIQDAAERALERLKTIQPAFSEFVRRNDVLRAAGSAALRNIPVELQSTEDVENVRRLNATLGKGEFASGIRLLKLQRALHYIHETDFRSPELQACESDSKCSTDRGLSARIQRSLRLTLDTLRSIAHTSNAIGTNTALSSADELHDACDHMPTGITDPLSATGASLGTTLHIALETGALPEKALLDAVKGLVGLTKSAIAGGVPEGPSARALVRVLLEVEEIEKGNRVRWIFKLGPSLAFALLKKPALVLKAQKLEEASGKVSPQMFESEFAKSKGRVYNAWKSLHEITRLVGGLIREGSYRWGVELPLTYVQEKGFPLNHLESIPITKPIVRRIAKYCGAFLTYAAEQHQGKLQQQMEACLSRIPEGARLANLDSEQLTFSGIRSYIDYRYNAHSEVSEQEVVATLNYWRLRETSQWYIEKQRDSLYRRELRNIDPRLLELHQILHGLEGLQAFVSNTYGFASLIQRKLRDPSAPIDGQHDAELHKQLAAFIDDWNAAPPTRERFRDTIVDAGPNGSPVVILLANGELELVEGAEGRARLLDQHKDPLRLSILSHADHARLSAAELALAMPLETYQREALLKAHERVINEEASPEEVSPRLLACSLSAAQLHGTKRTLSDPGLPGLFTLGIIGR